jgi:chaperone required for assembly of F1-ATPase
VKRFWDIASVEPVDAGYAILLDGRAIRLPDGAVLRVDTEPLACAIAEEWQVAGGDKGGEMSFADTPLTRLAGTAQQRIARDPAPTIDAIASYAESDMLCYRAETPEELVARQMRAWQPWLDWAALTYDAPLRVGSGIAYVKQHRSGIAALRTACSGWRWRRAGWMPLPRTNWGRWMNCSRPRPGARTPKPPPAAPRSRPTSRLRHASCN